MRLHITVFTYNRPEMLTDLLRDLQQQDTPHTITVYHDGRDKAGYNKRQIKETAHHHGKTRFHQLFNQAIKELPNADLYLFLPDDVRIEPGGLDNLLAEWEAIQDPDKALYNCLLDKNRTGLPNWTKKHGQPYNSESLKVYWWDLCGFIAPGFIQVLKRNPVKVNPERWRKNPLLSSGVGEYISQLAIQNKSIYQTRTTHLKHVGSKSQMNKLARIFQPMESWHLEPIVAGMATVRGREQQAMLSMASLANQVDRLYVVFNRCEPSEYAKKHPRIIPIKGDNKIGDGEKFRGLDICRKEMEGFYFLSVDDDIIYPEGYAWKMLHKIEEFSRFCAVTVHGKNLPEQVRKFYGGHSEMFHTKAALIGDKIVNCIGSGTAAFHSSTLEFGTEHIKAPNMADIWLSGACHRQGVKIVSIERPANWLKVQQVNGTIYDRHHRAGHEQTRQWNEIFIKNE